MKSPLPITVRLATLSDSHYAETIAAEMAHSAKARGTGIAFRTPSYIIEKMVEGKAIIAHDIEGNWAGFCYIEAWDHEKFVANSGLIVNPIFRGQKVATKIKTEIFNLSRKLYPKAKIFGLTTGLAVMKINSDLGYEPVTYSELTHDVEFWKGCKSCVNYEILKSKNRNNCICTAMLFDPQQSKNADKFSTENNTRPSIRRHSKLYERWIRFKKHVLLKKLKK